MRTFIYVDGFNLFYRALKRSSHKWLDLKALFGKILHPDNHIQAIKYFTARVSGKFDPNSPMRQQAYLRALRKHIAEIEIIYGYFLSHTIWMPLAQPQGDQRFARVIKTEEKGSDVNIAVHLLNDAWKDRFDCAVVVSNDSDLSEAVRIVKHELSKVVGIVIPGKGNPSKELMRYADFVKHIRTATLAASQLPERIPGTNIHKPSDW